MELIFIFLLLPLFGNGALVNDIWHGLGSPATMQAFLADKKTTAVDLLEVKSGAVVVGNGTHLLKDVLHTIQQNPSKRLILQVLDDAALGMLKDTIPEMKPGFATFVLRVFRGPNAVVPSIDATFSSTILAMKWPMQTKLCIGLESKAVGMQDSYAKIHMESLLNLYNGEVLDGYINMVELDAYLLSHSGDDFLGSSAANLKYFPSVLLRNTEATLENKVNIAKLQNIMNMMGKEKFILDVGDAMVARLNSDAAIKLPSVVTLFAIIFTCAAI